MARETLKQRQEGFIKSWAHAMLTIRVAQLHGTDASEALEAWANWNNAAYALLSESDYRRIFNAASARADARFEGYAINAGLAVA